RGHDALPLACRQFPRVSILEPRGVVVTLSCYCPTSRAMLSIADQPVTIVENPRAFPTSGEYVGLDARTSLPPALCPNLLMDWDSWYEWERLSVELWNLDEPLRQILDRLSIAVESVRTWRPGQGELLDRVRDAHAGARTNAPEHLSTRAPEHQSTRAPSHQAPAPSHPRTLAPSHLFLCCHTFASWPAHLGAGLRTWLRSLETVVFLLEQDWTIAEIDLWLRHYADPRLLARVWSQGEHDN
ncbi:MAG: hypothetical protein KA205_02510, partial [Acidobacteria bacterium]|nr:hypothetical protein [Acidobacteriota bacterium]